MRKEVPVPAIDEHQVLIQVEAGRVCHGDAMVADGAAGDYPHIPGHEVVGLVAAMGDAVAGFQVGDRVGVGWHSGWGNTTGLTMNGGYAQYTAANDDDALVFIPDEIAVAEAAPDRERWRPRGRLTCGARRCRLKAPDRRRSSPRSRRRRRTQRAIAQAPLPAASAPAWPHTAPSMADSRNVPASRARTPASSCRASEPAAT